MDARLFMASLAPASANGLPFHVRTESGESEPRLHTVAIPNGGHIVEKFGRGLRKYSIEAYTSGNGAVAQAEALLAMFEPGDVVALTLPTWGPLRVRATKIKREFDKDRFGHVALTIEAQDEPDDLRGVVTLDSLRVGVLAAAFDVVAAMAAALPRWLSPTGGPVRDALASGAASELGRMAALAADLRLGTESRLDVTAAFGLAADAIGTLPGTGAFGQALGEAVIRIGDHAGLPQLLLTAGDIPPRPVDPGPFLGVVDPLIAANGAALALATDIALLAAYATSAADSEFPSRTVAVQARALFADQVGAVLARLDGEPALAREISRMAGQAGQVLQKRVTDLAPIVLVDAPEEMPALWWSHRLYGTAARAGKVNALAGSSHPAYLPRRFSAEAF